MQLHKSNKIRFSYQKPVQVFYKKLKNSYEMEFSYNFLNEC